MATEEELAEIAAAIMNKTDDTKERAGFHAQSDTISLKMLIGRVIKLERRVDELEEKLEKRNE